MDVRVERLHKNIVSFKYKLYKEYLDRQNKASSPEMTVVSDPVKKKRGRKNILSSKSVLIDSDSDSDGIVVKKEADMGQALKSPVKIERSTGNKAMNSSAVKVKAEHASEASSPLDRRKSASLDRESQSKGSKPECVRKSVTDEPKTTAVQGRRSVSDDQMAAKDRTRSPSLAERSVSKECQKTDHVDSSGESEKEPEDKDKVVENPFFTDSEDSDEAEEQAVEKEKLVEMLYSLIKGDERGDSSPQKSELTTLPTVPATTATREGEAKEEKSVNGGGLAEELTNGPSLAVRSDVAAASSADPFDLLAGAPGQPASSVVASRASDARKSLEQQVSILQVHKLMQML
jgi:hypothetical protein